MRRPPRAVFDTNVIVSAILFGGQPRAAFSLAIRGEVELLISLELLAEVLEVLARPKFRLSKLLVAEVHAQLMLLSDFVETTSNIRCVKSDPDDNRVLECAVDGQADAIVSGDSDLLELRLFRAIPVLTAADFMDWLPAAKVRRP